MLSLSEKQRTARSRRPCAQVNESRLCGLRLMDCHNTWRRLLMTSNYTARSQSPCKAPDGVTS